MYILHSSSFFHMLLVHIKNHITPKSIWWSNIHIWIISFVINPAGQISVEILAYKSIQFPRTSDGIRRMPLLDFHIICNSKVSIPTEKQTSNDDGVDVVLNRWYLWKKNVRVILESVSSCRGINFILEYARANWSKPEFENQFYHLLVDMHQRSFVSYDLTLPFTHL